MGDAKMDPLDAVWLMMESADTPMHVGALAIFQKPKGAKDDYLEQLARRWRRSREFVAPFNSRLARGGRTFPAPRLVKTRKIDLDYHFMRSALPSPGGERELGVVVSRLHSQALDRNRPLWELHMIEGLERGRFAIYVKVHHALVNHVTGLPVLLSTLARSARQRDALPLWSRPLSDAPEPVAESEAWWQDFSGNASSFGQAASGLLRGVFSRNKTGGFALPRGAPASTLNRRINAQRRVATQSFTRDQIEQLAKATDSTVNEILTYLCGSSLRRFFKEYNALPDESLIGVIPVSLQEGSQRFSGNAIAGVAVSLGTNVGNPEARLESVKESIQKVRDDQASLPHEAVTPYVMMRAAPLYLSQMSSLGRLVPPMFNLTVSHTEASDEPLFLDGSRLEAIYPLSSLMQFSALSIDCVSYADTLNIGFTGARDTLPHLQRMAVYFGKAVQDLEELVYSEEGVQ